MKSFELEYKGKTYVLSMSRKALRDIEPLGYNPTNDGLMLNNMYLLFFGALKNSNPSITKNFAFEMLDELTSIGEGDKPQYSFKDINECLAEIVKPCYEDISMTDALKNIIKK